MVQQWEYKRSISFRELEELGQEGWELVSCINLNDVEVFYLKRPYIDVAKDLQEKMRKTTEKITNSFHRMVEEGGSKV